MFARSLLLLFPAAAVAAPFELQHSGRALDSAGAPVQGSRALVLRLLDGGGVEKWTRDYGSIAFEDGYYTVALDGLDTSWFSGDLSLEVSVGGQVLGPPSPLASAPRALVAASVPVGPSASTPCTAVGQVLFDAADRTLRVCVAGSWAVVGQATTGIVEAVDGRRYGDGAVASSCAAYRSGGGSYGYHGAVGDGRYRVDPDGGGALPEMTVYCDQTTDGGGWTLMLHSTYTGTNPAHPGVQVNLATRRATTIGSVASYAGIGTNTFYWMAMDAFKAIADQGSELRFQSDNQPVHSVLTGFTMNSDFSLDGTNEGTIRTELCGGAANCFIDARGLSTIGTRMDNHSEECLPSYSNQAWWYDNCFSYNATWMTDRGHFAGYSTKDSGSNHWAWWIR